MTLPRHEPASERVAAILTDAGFGETLPAPAVDAPHVPGPLLVRKLSAPGHLPADLYDELLASALQTRFIGPEPTEAEREERRRAHEARFAEAQADYQRTRELCAGQAAALAALDVHHPIDNYGIVCELSESDEWSTDWPCSTYEAIKGALPMTPALDQFLRIIESHLTAVRQRGRQPRAVVLHEQEAGRVGVKGATTVFGIALEHDATVPLGRCRMRLDDGTLREIDLPVWFTED